MKILVYGAGNIGSLYAALLKQSGVVLGFPGAAAVHLDGRIRYLITSAQEQPTAVGELDGARSPRIEAIERALKVAGFSAAICSNMDAWLKTHVAEISPTALALYMAGADPGRLARTRDATHGIPREWPEAAGMTLDCTVCLTVKRRRRCAGDGVPRGFDTLWKGESRGFVKAA